MNKNIEKIVNPPWLESIRRLERQTKMTALAFHESEAIRSIRSITESTKLAARAFHESETIKSMRVLAETAKLATTAFDKSEAMKTIRQMTESSRLAALAIQESAALKSVRTVAESSMIALNALQQSETLKQLQSMAQSSQFAFIALQNSEVASQLAQFRELSSFKTLADLKNSPFVDSTNFVFEQEIDNAGEIDESLIKLDAQVYQELSSQTDFNALSEKTKRILLYIYHYYFLPVLLSFLSTYIFNNALEARKELSEVKTPSEAKTFMNSENHNFDRSVLKGFGVTTANALNFRKSSNVNSEVIATLPVGTLFEVIDKSNRSWLFVEVEIDGILEEGWISRRYIRYFK